jgi:microcystin-dependent protein
MSKDIRTVLAAGVACVAFIPPASACGWEPHIGDICLFAFDFCPSDHRNYSFAEANGQLVSIAQNSILYSLLGTTYGGDGVTTFALPDLRGRLPVHVGAGPGLGIVAVGEIGGVEQASLKVGQMPSHTHVVALSEKAPPAPAAKAAAPVPGNAKDITAGDFVASVRASATAAGGSQPISIRSPYLGLRYCIAIFGTYPARP